MKELEPLYLTKNMLLELNNELLPDLDKTLIMNINKNINELNDLLSFYIKTIKSRNTQNLLLPPISPLILPDSPMLPDIPEPQLPLMLPDIPEPQMPLILPDLPETQMPLILPETEIQRPSMLSLLLDSPETSLILPDSPIPSSILPETPSDSATYQMPIQNSVVNPSVCFYNNLPSPIDVSKSNNKKQNNKKKINKKHDYDEYYNRKIKCKLCKKLMKRGLIYHHVGRYHPEYKNEKVNNFVENL